MAHDSGCRTLFCEEHSCVSFAEDDQLDRDALSASRTPSPGGKNSQGRGVCTISSNDAITIFNAAKHDRTKRNCLANQFAQKFGITPKAVRDIWNLRTWVHTTKPFWLPPDEKHFLKREHHKNTKRISMKQSVAIPAPSQEKDIPAISITPRFADSFWTQEAPGILDVEINECSVPPTAIRNVCPHSPATIAAHSDLRKRCFFDGEWMIQPSVIAQEFESIFLEWSNQPFKVCYDDFVHDNESARTAGL
jgi:hypothetical protein